MAVPAPVVETLIRQELVVWPMALRVHEAGRLMSAVPPGFCWKETVPVGL